jgi:transposase, IS30 family
MYTHISTDDRAVIASMLRHGYTKAEIARTTGFHRSSIGREIIRNGSTSHGYRVWHARHRADVRRKVAKRQYRVIETNVVLSSRIEKLLHPLISPEVVAYMVGVHHQTIYTWVYRSRRDLIPMLPYHGKKRRRYAQKREKYSGWTKSVHAIDERIESTLSWEGDTVKGDTRSQLLTHVERTSLYTRVDLIPDGTADTIHAVLKKKPLSGTITYDRGSEFALWRMIERDTGASVFFAHAHHPWERGKNENTNGRLRRVFPKRFDFSTITQRQLDCIVHTMNHTPRKSLSWRTPAEVYQKLCCSSG